MNLKLCILTTKRSSLITPVFVEIGYFHFHASGRFTATNALKFTMFMFMCFYFFFFIFVFFLLLSFFLFGITQPIPCQHAKNNKQKWCPIAWGLDYRFSF